MRNISEWLAEVNAKKMREDDLLRLFAEGHALVKILKSNQGDDIWWEDHLRQLVETKTYRPRHHQRADCVSNKRFNPFTGKEEVYVRHNLPGEKKNTLYAKKTDITFSHPGGKTHFYSGPSGTRDTYTVGLVFDFNQADPDKPWKYVFQGYQHTNLQNWKAPAAHASKERVANYWGNLESPPRTLPLKTAFDLAKISWAATPIVGMGVFSQKSIAGVCVTTNRRADCLNAIYRQQLVYKNTGVLYPIVNLPEQFESRTKLHLYSSFAQLLDIFHVLVFPDSESSIARNFASSINLLPIVSELFLRWPKEILQGTLNDIAKNFCDHKNEAGLVFLIQYWRWAKTQTVSPLLNADLVFPFTANRNAQNGVNEANQTIWHLAIAWNMSELLDALFKECFDDFRALNCCDFNDRSPVVNAVRYNRTKLLPSFFDHLSLLHLSDLLRLQKMGVIPVEKNETLEKVIKAKQCVLRNFTLFSLKRRSSLAPSSVQSDAEEGVAQASLQAI